MNARDEFQRYVKGKGVLCSKIVYDTSGLYGCYGSDGDIGEEFIRERVIIVLIKRYNEKDYAEFLEKLNFEYCNPGGEDQFLYGTIWYSDGSWAIHKKKHGKEQWRDKNRPEIDDECGGDDTMI